MDSTINDRETNIDKKNENEMPDLIDDVEEIGDNTNDKENENENENNIENGLNNVEPNGAHNIAEKPKLKKYVPKNEQEALKARIINLEMNEKPHYEMKENYMNDHLETSATGQIEKFKIPTELKKTFIIVMILAILGITLIICGFIKAISDATPGGGIMFWVLGTVVIIPGGFYSYQFYKAKRAKEEYKRQDILDNIPQL